MTGPEGPGDDWGFPEVDPAGPSSTALPDPPAGEDEEPAFDSGSDAWWRAQAEAQRRAAANEPPVAPTPPVIPPVKPPETAPPEVLSAPPPNPLDREWLPAELPGVAPVAPPEPTAFVPVPAFEPVAEPEPTAFVPEPEPEPVAAAEPEPYVPVAAAEPEPYVPVPIPVPEPTAYVPVTEPEPTADVPVPAAAVAAPEARAVPEARPVGRTGVLAGGAIALTGVLLAIVALLVFNGKDSSGPGPVVANPPVTHASATGAPSSRPSAQPTAKPTPSVAPSAKPTVRPSTPPPVVNPPASPPTAALVPVSVLNNSRIKGLAATAAARFRAAGWSVPTTGNYTGRIALTTIYYAAGQQASAERFARQFGIGRVLPRSALPGAPVAGTVVVLTRDYRA